MSRFRQIATLGSEARRAVRRRSWTGVVSRPESWRVRLIAIAPDRLGVVAVGAELVFDGQVGGGRQCRGRRPGRTGRSSSTSSSFAPLVAVESAGDLR